MCLKCSSLGLAKLGESPRNRAEQIAATIREKASAIDAKIQSFIPGKTIVVSGGVLHNHCRNSLGTHWSEPTTAFADHDSSTSGPCMKANVTRNELQSSKGTGWRAFASFPGRQRGA